jgi:hypothetical protein
MGRLPVRALTLPALALVLLAARPAAQILMRHEFTGSNQGWGITTDTGIADASFVPSGCVSGGCISGKDEEIGETWYFRAPEAVLAQLPKAEVISYSLKQSTNIDGGFLDDDVVIVGKAGRAGYRFGRGSAPGTAWKHFTVPLSATSGWRWNGGAPATEAQLRSVLEAPLVLEIRGEYVSGADEGFLDDFELQLAPRAARVLPPQTTATASARTPD